MKPKLIAISVAAALAVLSAPLAHAEQPGSPYYLSFGLGTSTPSDWSYNDSSSRHHIFHQDDGTMARLAFGRRFSAFRAEIEYSEARFDFGPRTRDGVVPQWLTGNDKRKAVSLNAYYDFYAVDKLSAYVGAGIGEAKVTWDVAVVSNPNSYVRDSDTVSAYRFILGFNYSINRNWLLGMDYRREVTDDIALKDNSGDWQQLGSEDQDAVLVNLSYRF